MACLCKIVELVIVNFILQRDEHCWSPVDHHFYLYHSTRVSKRHKVAFLVNDIILLWNDGNFKGDIMHQLHCYFWCYLACWLLCMFLYLLIILNPQRWIYCPVWKTLWHTQDTYDADYLFAKVFLLCTLPLNPTHMQYWSSSLHTFSVSWIYVWLWHINKDRNT